MIPASPTSINVVDASNVEDASNNNNIQYDKMDSPAYKNTADAGGEEKDFEGCSIGMLVLLSLPRMAIQMAWAAQWAALGPYLGTMLPKWAVQVTQLIGPLSGIFVAPTVGVMSDRSCSKWGRRRPYLLFGAITSATCWILMGYTRQIGEALGDSGTNNRTWTALFTVIFYTWMDITVNVVQTPAMLIVADFAGDRQTTGAGICQASSTLGSLLVSGYIQAFGAAHLTLRWFLGMLAFVMIITVGLVCIFAKEIPLERRADDESTTCSRIGDAFKSVYIGVKTLPKNLIIYGIVFFFVQYGFTAYNGNKGQFFGLEVLDGKAEGADICGQSNNCTEAQDNYNRGTRIAGGITDLLFSIVGYIWGWIIPFCVRAIGAKWVITISIIPQVLLMIMAFTKVVIINVIIVISTVFTQGTIFTMLVPVIIHVFGDKAEVGMYVGALNSANCFGQLLNFAIGTALVETSLGYALPVFVGGAMSFIGLLVGFFCLKIEMYSM
jgi:solute carrier family 45 protein 1/2/4